MALYSARHCYHLLSTSTKPMTLKRLFCAFRITEVTSLLCPIELCPEEPNQFIELVFGKFLLSKDTFERVLEPVLLDHTEDRLNSFSQPFRITPM